MASELRLLGLMVNISVGWGKWFTAHAAPSELCIRRGMGPGVSFATRTSPQAKKCHRIRDSIAEGQYGLVVTKCLECARLLVSVSLTVLSDSPGSFSSREREWEENLKVSYNNLLRGFV